MIKGSVLQISYLHWPTGEEMLSVTPFNTIHHLGSFCYWWDKKDKEWVRREEAPSERFLSLLEAVVEPKEV